MQIVQDSLAGKVAFVTGTGSGIGKAAAKLLAIAGARVAALTHRQEEADATEKELAENGADVLALAADVSSPAEMENAVAEIHRRWQRLDIVVANAGINGVWAPLDELSPEEWDRTLGVNLRGTFLTVKYSLPLLRVAGGSVVIVASVNGTRMFSNTGATAYSCSKAGQVAFSRMTALELAKDRIRVNTVCPGAISTEIDDNTTRRDLERVREPVEFPAGQIPLTHGRPGSPEQVAELIWFLSSDLSAHISGTEVFIDGTQSLLQG
ncbi:3-oxoacyl-[acyl-carrier-protein] reductase [Opitutaceae bacterium EW11]|nr:3-oxoacyl-[acyl-carrier-protein] reductase [Opitutaceae bacterium EW11]